MADSLHKNLKDHYESRAKAEAGLGQVQQQLMEAVDTAERNLRVESLVNSREEAVTEAVGEHEQIYFFAKK